MKKLSRAISLTLALAFATSSASGAEPFTNQKTIVSGDVSYGLWLGENSVPDFDLNYYGIGLGLRGGHTFRQNIYVGARFNYFFGQTRTVDIAGLSTDIRGNLWEVLFEAGYDVGLSPDVVFRPKLGLGPMQAKERRCTKPGPLTEFCGSTSETGLAISPGAELPVRVGPVILSPEMRLNLWTGEVSASGFVLGVHAGMHF